MAKEVLHKRFACTESAYGEMGHNKLWYVTVYDNGELITEYGRTGDPLKKSAPKSYGSADAAIREAEKLIAKKKKGKPVKGKPGERDSVYTELDVADVSGGTPTKTRGGKVQDHDLGHKAAQQIAKGDKIIERLVERFVNENIHAITSKTTLTYNDTTGMFSTPAGVVGQSAINGARAVLAQIRDLVEQNRHDDPRGFKLIDEYMRYVPQNVGRKRPSIELICPTVAKINDQSSILDSLQASLDMLKDPSKKKDKKKDAPEEKIWDVTLKLCEDKATIKRIEKLYQKTRKSMHACYRLNVKRVYIVDHHGMTAAFESKGKKIGNVWELWHGTRVGNILSILSKGMIIPPSNASHCVGRLYGDGLYFSDQSTKSLNYAYGYWGGGGSDNNCFMFLNDVAMGKYYVPDYCQSKIPVGYDSFFAKAGKSGVHNNEMIVPNTYQACPRYLIEFSS